MKKKIITNVVIPVYQISIDEAHPIPTNKFSGILIFKIDVSYLIKKIAENITSGKTGYAWVIDNNGIFLYHPKKEFIGENSFEIRHKLASNEIFERINTIQKEKILKGEEGTDWYISEWHRNEEGLVKKLIAYAPIKITHYKGSIIWSVAVVAPVKEVEGTIRSVQIVQLILYGIVLTIILLGGFVVIGFLIKWSDLLEREVIKKT